MYDRFRICKLFINFFKKTLGKERMLQGISEKPKAMSLAKALVFKLFAFSSLLLLKRLVLKSVCRVGLA
jgi:hypothetical protein